MSDLQAFGDNIYERDSAQYTEVVRNGVKTVSTDGDTSEWQTDPTGAHAPGESTAIMYGEPTAATIHGEPAGASVQSLEAALSGVGTVFADVSARLDRVYHGLVERQIELERREEGVRESEQSAARALADARREAQQLADDARREAGELVESADRQARDTVESARREAERLVAEARQEATETVENARREAGELVGSAGRERAEMLARTEAESARSMERSRAVEQQVAQRLAELGRREQELREREQQLAEAARQQQAERDWLNQYAQTLSGIAADLERAVGELQPVH